MLGADSLAKLQETSPHNPTPKASEERPAIDAELAATSAVADTESSLPIVNAAGGSGATASLTFATASAG
jgi:hypothetical protein